MRKISEGAEAEIYEAEMLSIPIAVKSRPKKAYRIEEIDSRIRGQRTRSEAKLLALASSNGIRAPRVLLLGRSQIFMERLRGGTLNTLGKKAVGANFSEAGAILSSLHALDIAHGDYTPANLLVDENGALWVIDFGLSEFTNSIESKALDILLMKRSIPRRMFRPFVQAYAKGYKGSKAVLERLAEIEERGRYQTRTLTTG